MKESFDLTTKEGLDQATSILKKVGPLAVLLNPALALVYAGQKLMKETSKSNSIDAQAQAAVDIIKAGKASGAKRVKVTLDQKAGANLSVPIDGVNVSAMVGSNGKMTLDVEY
ncbi:hypothetical protein [Pseudomonas sp. Pse1]|uniref:hypothetical protein n=1 Tax=Pseudomonas sp. Pse1 TaxID=2926020 RepID=UPI0021180460|nr:hypothetical protein [Pseudomonas sp. Pse1]